MNKEQFIYILKENEALKLKLQRVEQSTERLQTRYYDTETQLIILKENMIFYILNSRNYQDNVSQENL